MLQNVSRDSYSIPQLYMYFTFCSVVNCSHWIHLLTDIGVNLWSFSSASHHCYLMNFDGAVHLRCLYVTMFPRLMLLFVNWFMPSYGVVVTMFWLINCSHQTFILSLNYLNVGASYCTMLYFVLFKPFFLVLHSLLYSACYWNRVWTVVQKTSDSVNGDLQLQKE